MWKGKHKMLNLPLLLTLPSLCLCQGLECWRFSIYLQIYKYFHSPSPPPLLHCSAAFSLLWTCSVNNPKSLQLFIALYSIPLFRQIIICINKWCIISYIFKYICEYFPRSQRVCSFLIWYDVKLLSAVIYKSACPHTSLLV